MRVSLALFLVCFAQSGAQAHHSPAAYDQTAEVTFAGTITKVGWVNPHIYFTLAVPRPDGSTVEQEVQAGAISVMASLGLQKEDLAVGSEVTVRAFPNRRGPGGIVWGLDVTNSDGEVRAIDALGRVKQPTSSIAAASLSGRWTPSLSSVRGAVGGFRSLALTDAGRAAVADTGSQRAANANCTPWSAPRVMLFPVLRTIDVDAAAVKMSFDWMGAERIVHLDQQQHPHDIGLSTQGHSIGRWDGDTLVIDTVGFAADRGGISSSIPSGPRKRLVERLSLTEDRLQLRYEFTIEDPDYLSGSASYTVFWDHRPDLEPSGEACNSENAGRFLREE